MMLRVEVNAIAALLVKQGVFTAQEFRDQAESEAYLLDQAYEQSFPGWQSTEQGMAIVDIARARQTMKNWRP